jgi:hypothetical protein
VLPIFIGHDDREQEAYDVFKHSLARHSSEALHVEPLKHRVLRHMGLFKRPWHIEPETGQWYDSLDGKPFSTTFAFTRFAVCHYAREIGITAPWVLFTDCDFLALADVAELFRLADPKYAVMVVKHKHEPSETVKMDQQAQTRYARKNWSSCMLWNLHHPGTAALTLEQINTKPGSWLHGFQWLKDYEIGELSPEWNWIAECTAPWVRPKFVHYSAGGPWFENYRHVPYAEAWLDERERMKRI